ncbi:glycerate kinase [Protofrankia coriariae]|uniref:Glycerate kinase n=1 Tax=Protofrankia coriariae TaxID=1562887 RepID=A0ABR5F3H1_9ACTN|nr:glycerate kinase [Protofrankia coriariae]KLL11242.1 glycerate kinase [Protofrankia coriariae]
MTRVVLAPDKFKGSLSAAEVCAALAEGLRAARPDVHTVSLPVADGGDGTVEAALSAGYRRVAVTAEGPTGELVDTAYAERDGTAIVELADACGLRRLPGGRPAPLAASSYGVGQVVAAALRAGCRRVVLGIGGSASTDGGAGLVEALGAVLLPESPESPESPGSPERPGSPAGRRRHRGGGALAALDGVDLSGLDPRLRDTELIVACDVDNPLLGPHGAAAVYGPQKGATPDDVAFLERVLARWATIVMSATGTDHRWAPGAGAAGGVGFAALSLLGARLCPGIDLILDLVGIDDALLGADLVVTGEGSLDEQTLRGKAPAGVAARARAAGVPVVAVAGRSLLDSAALTGAGFSAVRTLAELEPDERVSLSQAADLLRRLAPRLIDRSWPDGPACSVAATRPAGRTEAGDGR